jgi:NTE family protein
MSEDGTPTGSPPQLQAVANPTNDGAPREPDFEDGIGLCLSGGGFRAMLFHLGTLWRMHELRLLDRLSRISSVSGGSITSGLLALRWRELHESSDPETRFQQLIVGPLRALAARTIDVPAIIGGIALPGSISDRITSTYKKALFGDATLQDLPDRPRFVVNATSLQSSVLWRFSKPYMGDYLTGLVLNPTVELASAVAASSAFPPVLSPHKLRLDPSQFQPDPAAVLQRPPFTTEAILADGGVYDNLGLETVWKRYRTCLVSDAGMKTSPEQAPRTDWIRGSMRVADLLDSQVRSLRKRQLIGSFLAPAGDFNHRKGAYWSIRGDIADYPAKSPLPCPVAATARLAAVPTRLAKLDADLQEKLINWGYAMSDLALRSYFDPALPAATTFPYARGIG